MAKSKNKNNSKYRRKGRRASARIPGQRNQKADPAVLDNLLAAVKSDPRNVEAGLSLAEFYDTNDAEEKIVPTLESLEPMYPFGDPDHQRRFDLLLAFGYLHQNKFLDAERIIARGLREFPEALDLYYAQAFLRASLREYEEALIACKEYLSRFESAAAESPGAHRCATPGHLSQLFNYMATAYREMSRFDEATEAYGRSIAADPGNHLPYLNQASLHVQKRDYDRAEETVQRGLQNCRQVQELRMLKNGCRKKTTVSACMIVKDEEEMLDGCLKSIRDWVDEIILVDTGSTDETVIIAESYGARVFHQAWEGDFAKHRNYSIDQATSDWIFIIDADEKVFEEDIPQIIRFLNESRHPLISVNVMNVYGKNEEFTSFLPSERFFKRDLGLRYKGIVHNQLDVPDGVMAARTNIRIKHYGYDLSPEKMQRKLLRSRELLEKQLEENPDNAFAMFNLAQQLRSSPTGFPLENAPKIIEYAGRAVALTDPEDNQERHIHLMCLDQLAWAYFYTGDYDQARKYAQRAITLKPDYLDPLLLMGHIPCREQKYDEALPHYQKYLEVQAAYSPAAELSNIILQHVDGRVPVYYALAMIYGAKNDVEMAREYYLKTLKLHASYQEANSRLGQIYMVENRLDDAEACFLKQLDVGEESHEAALGLATIYLQRGRFEEAEKYYLAALRIKPDDIATTVKLGRLYAEIGRLEEASCQMEKACEAGATDAVIQKELGDIYFNLDQYEKAAAMLTNLVNQGAANAEIYNNLGNCHFKMDDLERAEQCYQQALQYSPPLNIAYRNLGLIRARLNKAKEAIWALEKYLEVNPADSQFLHIIGDLHAQEGDHAAALPFYERYLKANPEDPLAIYKLSECYLHMGHADSAILGYQRVLQLDPGFKPAAERLAALPQTTR